MAMTNQSKVLTHKHHIEKIGRSTGEAGRLKMYYKALVTRVPFQMATTNDSVNTVKMPNVVSHTIDTMT